ncbi:2-keto-4-pentenoate hydratase [Mycolicibacterium litorale]|nr:2-keto-4-pentenoate hydratase [Mycolicibacterium litorale]
MQHAGTGVAPAATDAVDLSARTLLEAYRTHQPIAPLVSTFPGLTIDDAYRIQLAQVDTWLAGGRRILGRKVGLTSPAMQAQMKVTQPDFGHLMDDMFIPEHVPVAAGRFLQPRAEPEVAFVLGRDLAGPGVTVAAAAAAVDFVLPALEIIDSRIADWRIGIVDTIADNASSGGVVLGSAVRGIGEVDLRLGGCVLHRNGEIAGTGAGGAVLGSPLNSLAWLANTLGCRGEGLRAGQVILPGSITASVPFGPGDVITATMAGLGSVTAVIAAPEEQS